MKPRAWPILLVLVTSVAGAGDLPPASTGSVHGWVRDRHGVAAQGALVAAVPNGADRSAGTAGTGEDGGFEIAGLPPGQYGLTATYRGRAAAYRGGVVIVAGAIVRDLELMIGEGGITVSGFLRDRAGALVPRADVFASRFSDVEGDVFQVRAGQDGAYAITLPRGTYALRAESSDLRSKPAPAGEEGDATIDLVLRPRPGGPVPPGVTGWLRRAAIPVSTPEAGHGFADLRPLKKVVGDARIVALGEATHGTREFFQLKHRMLEYLATELGFSVFAIEASFPDALVVNDYVLEGRGEPGAALTGLGFWTWDTEEVLGMIRWMRRHNEDPARRVKLKFYGFDMQNPAASARALLEYLKKVDPDQAPLGAESLQPLASVIGAQGYADLPGSSRAATSAWIAGTLRRFVERKELYAAASSLEEWTLAMQHATLLRQAEAAFGSAAGMVAARDRAMAENVRWILDHEAPGTKIVLWGHNGHVAADPSPVWWDPMGTHLRRIYGSSMVVFGLSFNQGSFQAYETGKGLRTYSVGPAPPEGLDAALATAGPPLLALDLRRIPRSGLVGDWFSTPRPMRSIGSVFDEDHPSFYLEDVQPATLYDAILFVENTSAAKPNNPMDDHARRRAASAVPHADQAVNLDFEKGEAGKAPEGWKITGSGEQGGYRVFLTDAGARNGALAARLDREGELRASAPFGNLMQRIDAAPYRGRRVRLRAAVRAEVEGPGNQAQLWLRVDLPEGAMGFFDNMRDRPIISSDWAEYEIVGDVAADATTVNFGVILVGKGRAWIDDVSLTGMDSTSPSP